MHPPKKIPSPHPPILSKQTPCSPPILSQRMEIKHRAVVKIMHAEQHNATWKTII